VIRLSFRISSPFSSIRSNARRNAASSFPLVSDQIEAGNAIRPARRHGSMKPAGRIRGRNDMGGEMGYCGEKRQDLASHDKGSHVPLW
jgi:hypothetical protein